MKPGLPPYLRVSRYTFCMSARASTEVPEPSTTAGEAHVDSEEVARPPTEPLEATRPARPFISYETDDAATFPLLKMKWVLAVVDTVPVERVIVGAVSLSDTAEIVVPVAVPSSTVVG